MGKPALTIIHAFSLIFLLTLHSPTGAGAQSNDPFYKTIQEQGRSSFTSEEYNLFVGNNIDKYVDAMFDETRLVTEEIIKQYHPNDYYYIDIGSGPAPIGAYLENRATVHRINLPLSGFQDYVDERGFFVLNPLPGQKRIIAESEYLNILKDHFDRFIPREAITGNKKILIIDTVQEGRTLLNAHRRISEYFNSFNPGQEVEALGLLHPGAKPITSRPSLLIETAEQVSARLKKFKFMSLNNSLLGKLLFGRTLQDFSEYSRFEPGREISSNIIPNQKFKVMSEAMKAKMKSSGVPVKSSTLCEGSVQFLKQVFTKLED